MKLGTFMMPLHPPSRIASETLLEDREAIILADRLGFSEAYVGEHVTDLAENVTSCLMFLSSLAFDTHQIKLGSGTINMPNGHPAAIAANVAMLDHMLKGRFIMGISPGGLASDAEVFGNFGRDRLDMVVEAIDMVMAIWKGTAPYDLQGKYFNISTARTMIPDPGPGLARLALHSLHQDGSGLRVVVRMHVGLIPRFKLRKPLHRGMGRIDDARLEYAAFVALETAAHEFDEIQRMAKAGAGAVDRHKAVAAFDKIGQGSELLWGDARMVGVKQHGVVLLEVFRIQDVHGRHVIKLDVLGC